MVDLLSNRADAAIWVQGQWLRLMLRAVVPLLIAAVFLALLSARLGAMDTAAVAQALSGVAPRQWAGALLMTAISFWAVGHYDAVLHRHFATGLPDATTRRAGICAIAVSQTLGLGIITGAIIRRRMLPGQPLGLAVQLTAAVALSFLAGWVVVTSVVLLILPETPFKPLAMAVLAVTLGLFALAMIAPRWGFRWPNSFTLGRLIALCAVDTLAAGAAFYLLCPDSLLLTFPTVLPAFLLALGAGLATGTPGGLGAFEVTLLALAPIADPGPLLAAILAWRLTYYALPALLGAAVAIKGPQLTECAGRAVPCPPPVPARAELGLQAQGTLTRQAVGEGSWLAGRSGHFLIALLDPTPGATVQGLMAAAKAESRLPLLYKCSARTAVAAKAAGFCPVLIAREAWLSPQTYDLAAASRAGLRRKLRRAAAAGVTIQHGTNLPWPQLDRIAAIWAAAHGGERGFSMGRYSRDYVARQRVYVAWHLGQPVAFASFHQTEQEWALDLMRHGGSLPDGTMHSLIQAAVEDATREGVRRLSLAAVPEAAFGKSAHSHARLLRTLTRDDGAGLARFKSAFAPRWQPLYMATSHRAALPFAAAAIARVILHPPPIEQDHADYEFASALHPWHRQG